MSAITRARTEACRMAVLIDAALGKDYGDKARLKMGLNTEERICPNCQTLLTVLEPKRPVLPIVRKGDKLSRHHYGVALYNYYKDYRAWVKGFCSSKCEYDFKYIYLPCANCGKLKWVLISTRLSRLKTGREGGRVFCNAHCRSIFAGYNMGKSNIGRTRKNGGKA
jgi:hypothetical protein